MHATAIQALTAATPKQGDLLALLNNSERLSQQEVAHAEDLLKRWYPASHAVWAEHKEMQTWLRAQGLPALV